MIHYAQDRYTELDAWCQELEEQRNCERERAQEAEQLLAQARAEIVRLQALLAGARRVLDEIAGDKKLTV